ncbi:MAG: glycerol-3-phosphate 1-O-acyltransferase PlsY [Chloroflexi bacterium]|nr:glycerol-3-phosphate 1-O-acyltransferase PlsY [Chloroflexota bacterium]
MTGISEFLIVLPIAYLLGSIPFGVITGKLWAGIDIRTLGSGNSGATNALRTLGAVPALIVLIADLAKGVIAVLIAELVSDSAMLASLAGLAVIVGHSWPVFARFRGGRGVATGVGALFMLSPVAGLVATIGVPVAAASRYVSLGSIVGTVFGLGALIIIAALGRTEPEYLVYGFPAAVLIIARHQANISRLMRGEEHRIDLKARAAARNP